LDENQPELDDVYDEELQGIEVTLHTKRHQSNHSQDQNDEG